MAHRHVQEHGMSWRGMLLRTVVGVRVGDETSLGHLLRLELVNLVSDGEADSTSIQ